MPVDRAGEGITFLLTAEGFLDRPLLYLSYYFRQHRAEYYDRLQAVRDAGEWEGWLAFFLRGVEEVPPGDGDRARDRADAGVVPP